MLFSILNMGVRTISSVKNQDIPNIQQIPKDFLKIFSEKNNYGQCYQVKSWKKN